MEKVRLGVCGEGRNASTIPARLAATLTGPIASVTTAKRTGLSAGKGVSKKQRTTKWKTILVIPNAKFKTKEDQFKICYNMCNMKRSNRLTDDDIKVFVSFMHNK